MRNQLAPKNVPNAIEHERSHSLRSLTLTFSSLPHAPLCLVSLAATFPPSQILALNSPPFGPVLSPLHAPGPPGLRGHESLPKSALAQRCPGWPVHSDLRSYRPPACSCTATAVQLQFVRCHSLFLLLFRSSSCAATACSSFCSDPVRALHLLAPAVHFWLIQVRMPLFFLAKYLVLNFNRNTEGNRKSTIVLPLINNNDY
jgi:hypothetical protein